MNVIFIGPAGSGKTTLVWKFGDYLERQGYEVRRVNLDCAVENLPYEASFDIRKYFTLSDVMKKFKLGPNGALMKSVELIFEYGREIAKNISGSDFALVDTPGQLELVLFHRKKITELFREKGVCVFLMPADLIETPKDYYFLRLLDIAVRYRVDMPCVYAVSKADLMKKKIFLEKLEDDFSLAIYQALEKLEHSQRLVKVCMRGNGFDELFSLIYESFCACGDLS